VNPSRWLSVLLALSPLAVAPAALPNPENLLANGDFTAGQARWPLPSGAAIELKIQQCPAGDTVHQLWVGAPPLASLRSCPLRPGSQLAGYARDDQSLEFQPATPLAGVQYLRVLTLRSPSWVAWKEVEAIAP
jgi:hypothetical protein